MIDQRGTAGWRSVLGDCAARGGRSSHRQLRLSAHAVHRIEERGCTGRARCLRRAGRTQPARDGSRVAAVLSRQLRTRCALAAETDAEARSDPGHGLRSATLARSSSTTPELQLGVVERGPVTTRPTSTCDLGRSGPTRCEADALTIERYSTVSTPGVGASARRLLERAHLPPHRLRAGAALPALGRRGRPADAADAAARQRLQGRLLLARPAASSSRPTACATTAPPAQQARDRLRDQAHIAAGLTPLRFTHAQVRSTSRLRALRRWSRSSVACRRLAAGRGRRLSFRSMAELPSKRPHPRGRAPRRLPERAGDDRRPRRRCG